MTLTRALLVLLSISNVQTAGSSGLQSSNPPSNPPLSSWAGSSESDSDCVGTARSGPGLTSHASQTVPDSDVSSLTSVDSDLPSGVEEYSDSASDTEIVWAKGAHGVWGLANVFASGKLYFTRNVPEANCMPQGLGAGAPCRTCCQACPQSCQTSCHTLQACSQTCRPGGSQACSQACSWGGHSCGPC